MFVKPLTAASEKLTASAEKIANHQIAMQGNTSIGTIKGLRYTVGRGRQAGAKVFGKNMDNRVNDIVEARDEGMITPKNWVAKKFDNALNSENKYLSRGASMFYSGETGNLSTARIAGVAAGLGAGGYAVLGGDDRR